jgi:outer membrane protein assembly factor BamB
MHNPVMRTVLLGLLLLVAATRAAAQRPPERTLPRPIDFSAGQDDNLFSVLRSQDHIHEFETALAELDAGEPRAAIERLHQLLQVDHGGVVPVAPGRFLGLRLAVVTTMANLPPSATEAYEALVARELGSLGDGWLEQSPAQLLLLAERFPSATVGRRARLRLGDLALVQGDARTAVGHFRAALDASAIGSNEERRIAERLHIASVLLDPTTARAEQSERRLSALGSDALAALPPGGDRELWSAYGGGQSGRTPMPAPAGRPQRHWTEDVRAPEFGARREIGSLAMHAVGDLDTVFVNTGRELLALDPLRGARSWESLMPLASNTREYADSTNQDMVLAPACGDDLVVAALQVPENSMNVDFQGGFRIMSKIPQRRLFAFARSSRKLLWAHFDEIEGPRTRRFRGHDACANPLVAGDTVYLPIHDRSGAIAFSIAAYDARTGQPRWRRLVCSSQQDVNMFGNARTEFASSPLCLHDGLLFGASNLGTAFALEASTGRIRWIVSYEVTRMPRAMLHGQTERQIYFANNAPVVADGVVCSTPLDSPFVLGLDTESGRTLWRLPTEATVDGIDNRVVWLAGALDDEFVLAGAGCIAVKARPEAAAGELATVRQLARPDRLGERRQMQFPARPAVTADHVWIPRPDQILVIDRAGNLLGEAPITIPRYQPGNLLLCGGIVVSLRQRAFEVLFDGDALLARVQQSLTADPDDPAAILRLASLRQALLGAANLEQATAVLDLYRRGLQACDRRALPAQHPVRLALQGELFQRSLAAAQALADAAAPDARAAFAAARDLAPDTERWIEVQAQVLALCADDRTARAAELQRLLERGGDARFPLGEGIPVPVYVLWQRAVLADQPATAVALWQQLLEQHGEQPLASDTAAAAAIAAIARLIERHGPDCYAATAARADAALTAAGEQPDLLQALARTFPNSTAAATARSRLLDNAVRQGDLAATCAVLAQAQANGEVPPGVRRRVMVAAVKRQNLALAAAMGTRLQPFAATTSDWPDDGGATLATAVANLPPSPTPATAALSVPSQILARVLPTSPREFLRPLPLHQAPGFVPLPSTPLYVLAAGELRAIDLDADAAQKPALFSLPVEYVEHIVLCGDTLVVPDTNRLFGVDARTGEMRWQLPNPRNRLYEFLGIEDGVLQLWRMPSTAIGGNELLGVEPLSGTQLFALPFDSEELQPKCVPGALLHLRLGTDGSGAVQRLDPTTGTAVANFPLPAGLLGGPLAGAAGSITSRFYPQWLAGTAERLFLPLDNQDRPQLLAINRQGALAWKWDGTPGHQLLTAAHRDDRLVLIEMPENGPARAVVLQATTGEVLQEVAVGHDPTVLNWERSWCANPAPEFLAIDSHADATRRQRQLLCLGIAADRPTFVVELGADAGEIVPAPQFGPDFVAFATLPTRGGGGPRLHVLGLADRSGRLPDGRKSMRLDLAGAGEGMSTAASYTVIASGQGLLLLGTPPEPK